MRLKELRKEKNLSQDEIANAIGTSQTNIGRWEKGINEPTSSFVIKLADYFGVSIDYLLGREDDLGNISISSAPAFELTENEKKHITNLRKLPTETQSYIFGLVANLAVSS